MKILITGADGFIGSHLANKLLITKNDIYCLDIKNKNDLSRISNLKRKKNFKYIKLDVSDRSKFKNFLLKHNFNTIFHFASIVGVENYINNPIDVIKFNIDSTLTLLDTLKNKNTHIIFSSTSEVFGKNPEKNWNEESDRITGSSRIPRWSYSASKNLCEHLYFSYYLKYKTKITIVRFFNAYGPLQNPIYVVSKSIKNLLENKKPLIYDNGIQTRSFTFIDDIIQALTKIIGNEKTYGNSYNIGNNKEVKIKDIIAYLAKLFNKPGFYKNIKTKKLYGNLYEDIPKRSLDNRKAKKDLNWSPKISYKKGLELTVKFYNKSK